MHREPYLPPRKSTNERIEELKKERDELDRKIRHLEEAKRELSKEVTMYTCAESKPWDDRKKPYWMKSGRHG